MTINTFNLHYIIRFNDYPVHTFWELSKCVVNLL